MVSDRACCPHPSSPFQDRIEHHTPSLAILGQHWHENWNEVLQSLPGTLRRQGTAKTNHNCLMRHESHSAEGAPYYVGSLTAAPGAYPRSGRARLSQFLMLLTR